MEGQRHGTPSVTLRPGTDQESRTSVLTSPPSLACPLRPPPSSSRHLRGAPRSGDFLGSRFCLEAPRGCSCPMQPAAREEPGARAGWRAAGGEQASFWECQHLALISHTVYLSPPGPQRSRPEQAQKALDSQWTVKEKGLQLPCPPPRAPGWRPQRPGQQQQVWALAWHPTAMHSDPALGEQQSPNWPCDRPGPEATRQ